MVERAGHIKGGTVARLVLLGTILVGKCGLMAAMGCATDAHAHEGPAPALTGVAVSAPHAGPVADPCCVDTPALASQGVWLDKVPGAVAFGEAAGTPVALYLHPASQPRAPPPRLHSDRHHVRLQIFLI